MIRNKVALIASFIILAICMSLFFPFPNNVMIEAKSMFMSFPIHNQDGYILLGILGSILFVIAMVLLGYGINKYRGRTIVLVIIVYMFLPQYLITLYQETLASGINAISYNGEGECSFESGNEELMNGECELVLHNRSNEAVSFEIEFLDSPYMDDVRMESLMNIAGPHTIRLGANEKRSIHIKKVLELSEGQKQITAGTSYEIHFKLIEADSSRIL